MTDRHRPAGQGEPRVLVFSDVDETLINCKSMLDFLTYYFRGRHGRSGARKAARIQESLAALTASGTPRSEANRSYYRAWRGEPSAAVAAWGARWFADRSASEDFYIPRTRTALLAHRSEGAAIALVSGSFPALLAPLAAEIGATRLLCSTPESYQGTLTGGLTGPPVIGEAKRAAVRSLLSRHPSIAAADCYAYGDHISDLPMLTEVGHPVVIGDNEELHARISRAAPRGAAFSPAPCSGRPD